MNQLFAFEKVRAARPAPTISCVWIATGNPRQPLACVWTDSAVRFAQTSEPDASEDNLVRLAA